MRKKLMGFLLVPVLLLAIVSCDDNIFGTISDFMGQAGANVYVDGGLVQVDTSQGETVSNALAELTGAIPDPGDTEAYDTYVADYQEQVETAKTAIVEALASETKKEVLVAAMTTELPITDENPIEDIIPPRVDDIVTDFNAAGLGVTIDYDGIQTEGDLVALVLITEFYDSVKGIDVDTLDSDEALALVSEAQQVIEIVQAISPTGAVTLDEILGGLISDQALLDQLLPKGTARSTTREGEDDFDPSTILEPIFNTVINAIGKGDDGYILSSGLKRMQTNFSMMRIAYEQMAPALAGSGKALELTDSINYALSVIFTEADAFLATVGTGDITFESAINDVIDWIDAGKDTENPPAFTAAITDWGSAIDAYATANSDKFSTTDGSEGTVIKTIEALLRATPDSNFILVQLGLEEPTT